MRERKYGGGNKCRNLNNVSNASVLENTRLQNVNQSTTSAGAVAVSIGPVYARKTTRGNGNAPTARQRAMGVIKVMGQRTEDARSSWRELTG